MTVSCRSRNFLQEKDVYKESDYKWKKALFVSAKTEAGEERREEREKQR